jgi:hypothetical protein
MGDLSPKNFVSLLGNKIWTIGCTWLPKISIQSLAVIQTCKVIIGPIEYQDIAAQINTDLPPFFTVETRHSGIQASLGVLQTQTRPIL